MGYSYYNNSCGSCGGRHKKCGPPPKRGRPKNKRTAIIGALLIGIGLLTVCVLFLPLKAWILIFSAIIIALGVALFL